MTKECSNLIFVLRAMFLSFQITKVCKCSCCLGDPREYFRPGSLISDDGSQVFEALNSFKLLATDLDGTADAVVIHHQLGLLCTDLHAISC